MDSQLRAPASIAGLDEPAPRDILLDAEVVAAVQRARTLQASARLAESAQSATALRQGASASWIVGTARSRVDGEEFFVVAWPAAHSQVPKAFWTVGPYYAAAVECTARVQGMQRPAEHVPSPTALSILQNETRASQSSSELASIAS